MNRISAALKAGKTAIIEQLPEKGSFGWIMMMMGLATIPLILLPFAFWFAVWHGPAISQNEIQTALAEPVKPSQAAAILLRLAEKISRGDDAAVRWYPRIVELTRNESAQLRRTVAWAMGKDSRSPEFRKALHQLLGDQDRTVRRSAAISLASYGDATARQALLESIGPQVVKSTTAGSIQLRIQPADTATAETTVAMVGETLVEAGIAGTVRRLLVKEGDLVSRDQELLEIVAPVEDLVNALRALALVGNAADVPVVRKCSDEASGTNKSLIQKEAERTLRQIAARQPAGNGVATLQQ